MKSGNRIILILGSHAHIPSGASDSEFEFIYENKLRPFVTNLYRYSKIQAVLHYSGVFLYWIERNHPEFFMLIEDMVARKQAEILSGGFYEPVFPIIPLQDRIGQIEFLTTYLRKHFGKRPLGCWLPAFVWEPHLVSSLAASDIQFTFLSQRQFELAGLQGFYPCISEDQGKIIIVFPVSLSVGDALASNSFSQVFTELKNKIGDKQESIFAVFPDKPFCNTEEAQDSAWNRFFEEISLSENLIELSLPSRIIKSSNIRNKASFPNSSMFEDNYSPRRFLIDNCEAAGIYSKMIFTNVLIGQLKGDKSRKLSAREELWKAQDSSLFIPGAGTKRSEIRKAAYSSLLRAEKLSHEKGVNVTSLVQYDFNLDGTQEFLLQDAEINCYIQLRGAGIIELDYLPMNWNFLDCGCNEGLRRTAFADILAPLQKNITDITKVSEGTRLCFNEEYESLSQDRKGKSCFKLSALESPVPFASIEIEKSFLLVKDILTVSYNLVNSGGNTEKFIFAPLVNFSFIGPGDDCIRCFTFDNNGKESPAQSVLENIRSIKILDIKNEIQILLGSEKTFTGCIGHDYYENYYQATCIQPLFEITLNNGESWTNEFTLHFSY